LINLRNNRLSLNVFKVNENYFTHYAVENTPLSTSFQKLNDLFSMGFGSTLKSIAQKKFDSTKNFKS
jgi:hypothetical protein